MKDTQPRHEIFNMNSEFLTHFYSILPPVSATTLNLLILDDSGELLKLHSAETIQLIDAWISSKHKVKLLTLNADWLERNASRFLNFRSRTHLLEWNIASETIRSKIQESCVISPSILIRKPVRTAYHGYITDDSLEIKRHADYFEEAWSLSEPAAPTTPLGL